ncbi:hypothetical protein CR513_06271, partial [Mucuna pruriens]
MEISRSILLLRINCLLTIIGDISSSLTNVFVSRGLMSNLVSVGQLLTMIVQSNSHRSTVGKIITKGLKCLGHPNSNVLHDMLKYGVLGNKHTPSLNAVHFDCISCKVEKSILDDFSRFTWVYFLRSKYEVFSIFKFFYAYVQTQFSSKIKIFRSNSRGGIHVTLILGILAIQWYYISKVMPINPTTKQVILFIKRAFYVIILTFITLGSLEMLSSKKIIFFATQYDFLHSLISILTLFSNSSVGPSQDNSLVVSPVQEPKSATLRCSSNIRKPLERPWRMNPDGSIDHYKAWVVVLANKQEYGLDYHETFALVSKMITAPRVWFEKFHSTILGFSFTQSQYDPSLFLQRTPKGIMVLLVYVDDIMVIGSNQEAISRIKHMLHSTFHMKELGKIHSRFDPTSWTHKFNPIGTPLEVNVKYRLEEGDILDDPTLYLQLVGNLIYVIITRLDISFVVHSVSKFMQSPGYFYFLAVQQIIRYLLGTSKCGLFFPTDSSLNLQAYSDLGSLQAQPTLLHADNTSVIQITANPVYHEQTKHIEVNCHLIREAYDRRVIYLPLVSTSIQIVNIFTKRKPGGTKDIGHQAAESLQGPLTR